MSTAISGIADRSHHHHHSSDYYSQPRGGFLTPPPVWKNQRRCSPVVMPASEKKPTRRPLIQAPKGDLFHVIHKVPSGDSPYVRAKHVQLIDKDPGKAVSLFWSAINAGDRVDSALKDMAVVMKQLDRSDEAIEAIKSFRHLCPLESQESLDNILIELYKQSGRIEEEIEMLQVKLKQVEEGIAFGGKRTKIARSQGKKVQITVEKEYSRLLGNLAWAYMQQNDFKSAEEHYRKALSFESDKNKQCNLAICLMHMNRMTEAKFLLQTIKATFENGIPDESYAKSYERATQSLSEFESEYVLKQIVVRQTDSKRDICPVKKMLTAPFTEHPYEKRSDYDWRMNHHQYNSGQESYAAYPRPYDSPFCNRSFPKAPFTQPQLPRYGDQRRGTAAFGNFCRKLSFETSTTLPTNQNANCCSFIQPAEGSKVITQISDESTKNPSDGLPSDSVFYCEDSVVSQQGCIRNQKKSWADMVEEDERELENWRDEFNNENADLNINTETPKATDDGVKLSQKMELMELSGGYFTQPEKNMSARRSLRFDQNYCKPDIAKSPCNNNEHQLATKALNFDGQDLALPEDFGLSKRVKKWNRLQVFQDITTTS